MALILLGLLRRFWPTLALGTGTLLFSGLRSDIASDVSWDKLILAAITLLMGYLTLRKDQNREGMASLERTVNALKEENKQKEELLAETQRTHSQTVTNQISETQETILKALQAQSQENRQRIGRIERQIDEMCTGLEKAAQVAEIARKIALHAVSYRNSAIQELLDVLETLDYPIEKRPLVEEMRSMLKDNP